MSSSDDKRVRFVRRNSQKRLARFLPNRYAEAQKMLRLTATAFLIALSAVPALAQGRYGNQGIPNGQLPPVGMCRVWYDNLPPGRQPSPTSCDNAERVASRDR